MRQVDTFPANSADLARGALERVSRFVVTGRSGSRRVRFHGITISRFEDGRIVEDWSVTDTLGLLRQLGPWRSVLLGLRTWRMVKAARRATVASCRG